MISIVIPAWNQHETTRECIEALRETTENYEMILVDNGSDPPIEGAAIRNETNLGFPAAVNQGIRAAKGDIVVLLNNDVVTTVGWAERLAHHLDEYSIIGPMTNYCAGMQRTAIPSYEDRRDLYEKAMTWSSARDGQATDVNWIIGFCFAFRRPLFDEIGEFDESMWPCSGEEIDFCFRARERGHRVGIARDVYVHHEGSQTFREMDSLGLIDYADLCEKTSEHIAERWGADFWKRQRTTESSGLRINLGCGRFPLAGFINVDQFEEVEPDLVADILDLPYEAETVDEIYAGHVLEHFDGDDGEKVLSYWHSLLVPGGRISISVPDFDVLVKRYAENPTTDALREMNDTYIYSGKQRSPHLYAYSGALLMEVMREAGFADLERMPIDHPYFPHPVDWQVGYTGVKR